MWCTYIHICIYLVSVVSQTFKCTIRNETDKIQEIRSQRVRLIVMCRCSTKWGLEPWCRVRRQAQNTFTASGVLQIFDTVNWKLKPITDNTTIRPSLHYLSKVDKYWYLSILIVTLEGQSLSPSKSQIQKKRKRVIGPVGNPDSYPLHNSKLDNFKSTCLCNI